MTTGSQSSKHMSDLSMTGIISISDLHTMGGPF